MLMATRRGPDLTDSEHVECYLEDLANGSNVDLRCVRIFAAEIHRLRAERSVIITALKDLSDMYTHAWDLTAGAKKVDSFDQEHRLWTIIYRAGLSSVPAGIENAVKRLCTRAADADSAEDLLVKAQAEILILKRAVLDKDRAKSSSQPR